jgi:toxin ParE1/3/4
MANARYSLTDQAVADLQGVAQYIGERNVEAADRVLDVLYETFSFLAENPGVGTSRDDLSPGLRVFSPPRPAHNYVVAYFQSRTGVEVAAVIHGARDWPSLILGGDR